MEEIKMDNGYTMYQAPAGKIFIHKVKGIEVFGKAVVVHEDQTEYLIDDFKLITDKKFDELMLQKEGDK